MEENFAKSCPSPSPPWLRNSSATAPSAARTLGNGSHALRTTDMLKTATETVLAQILSNS